MQYPTGGTKGAESGGPVIQSLWGHYEFPTLDGQTCIFEIAGVLPFLTRKWTLLYSVFVLLLLEPRERGITPLFE
jgi:hypothetical protein